MNKIALCFVSILEEKCSGIFRARPPVPAWSLLGPQGSTSSGTWSTSSPPHIPSSNLAFCKLLFHTFLLPPLCPCGILPFLKNVFPEVPPLWLRISALADSGFLLDCAWHGAAPAVLTEAALLLPSPAPGDGHPLQPPSVWPCFALSAPLPLHSLITWGKGGNIHHHGHAA